MPWKEHCGRKSVSAHDALQCVSSGQCVNIHTDCAEPEVLVRVLIESAPNVQNVEVVPPLTSPVL